MTTRGNMSDKPMSEERAVCQEIEKAEAETAALQARLDDACNQIAQMKAHDDPGHCLRNYERAEALQAENERLKSELAGLQEAVNDLW
jgi:hypothetical protein